MVFLQIACSVDISATWTFAFGAFADISVSLIAAQVLFMNNTRRDSKMKTIVKTISLMVGTAFLGWRYVPTEEEQKFVTAQ